MWKQFFFLLSILVGIKNSFWKIRFFFSIYYSFSYWVIKVMILSIVCKLGKLFFKRRRQDVCVEVRTAVGILQHRKEGKIQGHFLEKWEKLTNQNTQTNKKHLFPLCNQAYFIWNHKSAHCSKQYSNIIT